MDKCWMRLAAGAAALLPMAAALGRDESAAPAQTVVVTGSLRELAPLQAPYAITAVGAAALREAGPMVNLSEALVRVPGLVAANRNNYAQDLQISARGFGARAGFGVRGLRLYADGIPATMPDGQGQVAHFDLAGAQQVEVLRGPFSALYGNSSGGVIALLSAPVRERRTELAADAGSFGLRQVRAALALPLPQGSTASASFSSLELDGPRAQAAASRRLGNLRVTHEQGAHRLALSLSLHEQDAQDPLGLTRAQFDADWRQTTPQARQFDTRKKVEQSQAGLRWRFLPPGGSLREASLAAYLGSRSVVQWLAIAPATQASARHGGGVIDFDRDYGGLEARLRWALAGGSEIAAGFVLENQADERRGFENFVGSGAAQQLGVTGRLRRDESNRARSSEAYAQAEVPLAAAWRLTAGVRSGRLRLTTADRFLANGDDSGALRFGFTNPVLGLRLAAAPGLVLHASAARGYESPTLGELAYRGDAGAGFNTTLRAQKSRQAEAGIKWRAGAAGPALDLALFRIATQDEIGVLANSAGRASFQNVGRTRRQGLELAFSMPLPAGHSATLAANWLDARHRDPFLTCTLLPCAVATVPVPAGKRIAGTSRAQLFAELVSPDTAWGRFGIETRAVARVTSADSSDDAAAGHALVHLRWSRRFALGGGHTLEALARIDNLADRRHAGSVIVNDANGRVFEPGSPRAALLALRWAMR